MSECDSVSIPVLHSCMSLLILIKGISNIIIIRAIICSRRVITIQLHDRCFGLRYVSFFQSTIVYWAPTMCQIPWQALRTHCMSIKHHCRIRTEFELSNKGGHMPHLSFLLYLPCSQATDMVKTRNDSFKQ